MTPREATVVFQAGPLDVDIRPATSLTQLEQSTVSIESGDVGQPLGMEFEIRLEQAGIWLRAGSTGHVCDRRAGRGWSPCRCGGEALESEMRHETAASFAIEEGGAGGHRIGPRLTARVAQNGRGPAVSGPVTGTVPPLHRTNTPPADASSGKTSGARFAAFARMFLLPPPGCGKIPPQVQQSDLAGCGKSPPLFPSTKVDVEKSRFFGVRNRRIERRGTLSTGC
jgi:hypothetical protein